LVKILNFGGSTHKLHAIKDMILLTKINSIGFGLLIIKGQS